MPKFLMKYGYPPGMGRQIKKAGAAFGVVLRTHKYLMSKMQEETTSVIPPNPIPYRIRLMLSGKDALIQSVNSLKKTLDEHVAERQGPKLKNLTPAELQEYQESLAHLSRIVNTYSSMAGLMEAESQKRNGHFQGIRSQNPERIQAALNWFGEDVLQIEKTEQKRRAEKNEN